MKHAFAKAFAVLYGVSSAESGGPGGTCFDDVADASQSNVCAMDGSDYEYTETIVGNMRKIVTNHCPNHAYISLTPNFPWKDDTTYRIPLYPEYVPAADAGYTLALGAQGGGIGVLLDGAMYYSAYGGIDYGGLNMTAGVNGARARAARCSTVYSGA